MPPRDKVRVAIDGLINENHIVLTREQTRRREQTDEADRKANEAMKQNEIHAIEVDNAVVTKVDSVEKQVEKHEVAIVGVWIFMPVEEIAWEAYADEARRITKRVEG